MADQHLTVRNIKATSTTLDRHLTKNVYHILTQDLAMQGRYPQDGSRNFGHQIKSKRASKWHVDFLRNKPDYAEFLQLFVTIDESLVHHVNLEQKSSPSSGSNGTHDVTVNGVKSYGITN